MNERGRTAQEEKATAEISRILAAKFKAYMDGCQGSKESEEGEKENDKDPV